MMKYVNVHKDIFLNFFKFFMVLVKYLLYNHFIFENGENFSIKDIFLKLTTLFYSHSLTFMKLFTIFLQSLRVFTIFKGILSLL